MTLRMMRPKTDTELHAAVPTIRMLIEQIGSLLEGQDPDVAGAALADLMATLLAAHFSKSGAKQTKKLRAYLLKEWVRTIEGLIPVNEKILLSKHPEMRKAMEAKH